MGYHEMVPVPSITYIYVLGYVHSENDRVRTRSKIPGVGQIEACMHGIHSCMHTRTKLGACVQEVHAQARSGPTTYCAWCITSIRRLSRYRQPDRELHDLENMSKLHQHMPGKVAGLSRCSRSAVAVVQSSPDTGTVHMYVGSQHEHHRRCKTSYSGFGVSVPESFRRRIHADRWSWSRTGCGCRTPSDRST